MRSKTVILCLGLLEPYAVNVGVIHKPDLHEDHKEVCLKQATFCFGKDAYKVRLFKLL